MNGPAVVADVPPQRPHNIPTTASLVSYNISLNLSSIFAMLPGSKFLALFRRGAYETPLDTSDLPTSSIAEDWATDASRYVSQQVIETASAEMQQEQIPAFPGPWAFFTSGYTVGLFIMAVLLHRMQNVIIPSRIPTRRARHAYRFTPTFATPFQNAAILQRLYASILPLNFSRTTTRLILHLPSVYFLLRMLVLWCLLILQTSELFPTFTDAQKAGYWGVLSWIESFGKWGSEKDMAEICWSTFCAVCAAFLVEGFVKALDGLEGGFPIGNVNTSTSPFNLVGYAFLLHVYSSPIAHAYHPPDGLPSRPDKHVLITITIPLLQLTIFHVLSISKRLSTHRLLPTALTSILSLVHFHTTLISHVLKLPSSPSLSPSTTATSSTANATRLPPPYIGPPNASYPLLNYIPNVFETFLISTILLTILINALVQLLVRGRVDRVFSGLGLRSGANIQNDDDGPTGFFQSLPYEEDFGVLLLRVGTASLEATGLRGWGNEVAPIQMPVRTSTTRKKVRGGDALGTAPTYGRVRMGRLGVGEVTYGSASQASTSMVAGTSSSFSRRVTNVDVNRDLTVRPRRRKPPTTTQRRGFNNDVRVVDLGIDNTADSANAQSSISGGSWRRWFAEVGPFLGAMWGVLKGLVVFLLERARGRVRVREQARKGPVESEARVDEHRDMDVTDDHDDEALREEKRMQKEREVYERFLRGEEISDDDDEDNEDEDEEEGSSVEDTEETESVDEGDEAEAEAVGLFTDLLRNGSGSGREGSSSAMATGSVSDSGEMVLAHLMHGSGASPGPLTRRRWNSLFRRGDGLDVGGSGSLRRHDDDDDMWEPGTAGPARQTVFDPDVRRDEGERESERGFQNLCVICTTEGREIICWPCRCLAMCDNCRESLASRSAPTKHRCPCCRQTVEGYSRIYIP